MAKHIVCYVGYLLVCVAFAEGHEEHFDLEAFFACFVDIF
jgi:hypothetical protein